VTKSQKEMLQRLLDNDPDESDITLSDWEVDFIESLNQLHEEYELSPAQNNILETLHSKLC